MFTRATGLFIVPVWLAAMGWLGYHDIWPTLIAQEPPRLVPSDWLKQEGKQTQYAIYREGERIGTIWTRYTASEDAVQVNDLIWINRLPVPVAPLRATAEALFTPDGMLDEMTVQLENYGVKLKLHGERFHSHFAFHFESGPMERAFKISLADGATISDAFHPFGQLGRLRVGQSWKMQVYNPIADLIGIGDRFVSVLVKVTGTESIVTSEGKKHCFIVESPASKAWVNGRGEVLVQESTLPVIGKIRIVRESGFDEDLLRQRRRQPL
ncbi:MAG: hypothetical protein IID33_10180, partial [Planctomycetes bacterium]|nr:hypothetical protein [Planctomycetota bacterium]